MLGTPQSWYGDLYAASRAAAPPAAISHLSAAALYDLPGGDRNVIEVTCRRWKRSQRSGLVVHESSRFDEYDITELDGISVGTAELLIMQLAGRRPYFDFVERVLHAARRRSLISYGSMSATFERLARSGVRGVKVLRAVLEQWDPTERPTESEMETMLLQILRAHGLPEPVIQFDVVDDDGHFIARTDAALPQWRITLEYQSKQEHSNELQLLRDDRRRNAIIAAGYFPLAARLEDLRSGGQRLVADIRRIARRVAS